MTHVRLALLVLAVLVTSSASAATIYDNGAVVDGGFTSDAQPSTFTADDFSLAAGANTLTDIHWTGFYFNNNTPPAADDFTIQFYADAGGVPALSAFATYNIGAAAQRTDTGIDVLQFDVYSYSIDIAPLSLTPGTVYWLLIFNDTSLDLAENWFWGLQAASGNSVYRQGASGWLGHGNQLDFELTGDIAVAEPTTLSLFGVAIAGLLFLRASVTRPSSSVKSNVPCSGSIRSQ